MKSNQPKIELPQSRAEQGLVYGSYIFLLLHILMILYYYNQLPVEVPRHFGIDGQPDAWSEKTIMWLLPAIALGLVLFLNYIRTIPHLFNYPRSINPENMAKEYAKAKWGVALMSLGISVLFFFLSWKTIQIALGHSHALGWGFTILLALVVVVPIIAFLKPPK